MEINTSTDICELVKSIRACQLDAKNTPKDTQGYGYKYTELPTILEYLRPLWAHHDIAVIQCPVYSDKENHVGLITRIMHASTGQFIESRLEMPVERIVSNKGKHSTTLAQAYGSVITYMRRYALQSMFSIASEDDDGQQNKWNNNSDDYANRFSNNERTLLISRVRKLATEQNKYKGIEEKMKEHGFTNIGQFPTPYLQKMLKALEADNVALENMTQEVADYE